MAVAPAGNFSLPIMKLVRTTVVPIIQQLHLEERLLRTSSDNWCIINEGTNTPTIVMGVSGALDLEHKWHIANIDLSLNARKVSELIELESVLQDRVPIIRRFTGGGTVIVDKGTVFVTFICNKDAIPGLQLYPRPIMSWTGQLYAKALQDIGEFSLFENDYVFGNRKFGGNAQSITRNRWIHHTSFLWDYDAKNMRYLKLPSRAPKYRTSRDHVDFLCSMKDYLASRSEFIGRTIGSIQDHFSLVPVEFDAIIDPLAATYPHSSKLLTEELEVAMTSVRDEPSSTSAAYI